MYHYMKTARVVLVATGFVLLVGVGFLLSPLFYDRVVDEAPPAIFTDAMEMTASPTTSTPVLPLGSTSTELVPTSPRLTRGSFVGLLGHRATGTVVRVQTEDQDVLRFQEDFVATNGPDLFVYLGKDGKIDKEKRLAALKGNKGSQNYVIPPEWDVEGYDEVWIWCRAFSVVFARATLEEPAR